MVVNIFIKKIKSLFSLILNIFKRALCCFRRRKLSTDFVPLTQIGVVSDQSVEHSEATGYLNEWDEPLSIQTTKPNSVDQQIQFYRQKTIAARQVSEEAKEVDEHFFDDMAPTITKQTKVFINNQKETPGSINRLSFSAESDNLVAKELQEWEDDTGWEDETLSLATRQALIENRRQARQKKIYEQQQRRHDKFGRPPLGSKVCS